MNVKSCPNTNWLGKRVFHFKVLASTNTEAKEGNYSHGDIVLADKQTAGRGRKGRSWVSETDKGLYFSAVLESIPFKNPVLFSFLFPLGVKESIQRLYNIKPKIKLPNDVYIRDKKVSGVLTETQVIAGKIQRFVVGVGVNLNQTERELKGLEGVATSLFLETGKAVDKFSFLCHLLETVEGLMENLTEEELVKQVNNSIMWKGEEVYIPDTGINGILEGINKEGYITIRTKDGTTTALSGDLSLRRKG
ncbi:MAG: biotin--[acetyl-CoA-carboxylase] ligase [Aquificae bacterium]|nr:biotin--[acetyl-CoA-carboxylase] ligase [Aquificota bacterium]